MRKKKNVFKDLIFGHMIALLACVAFPGFVTAIAPVSWIRFERQGDDVHFKSKTCLFFFIPYSIKVIHPVIGIGDRFVAGHVEERASARERSTRTEDEAFLVVHGIDKSAEIPVTPFNIKSVTERAQKFLDNANARSLRMTVVANWKFSVLVGGLVSLLTLLYIVGILLTIFQGMRRLLGFSKKRSTNASQLAVGSETP